MKKILIVGANSYIGTTFENWLLKTPYSYEVDTVGTMNGEWKEKSFKNYDSILHVAGIAHVSAEPKLEDLYYKVNRDLAIEVAEKAKAEGVSQFIFMSSIIIYGKDGKIGEKKVITRVTDPDPVDFYGDSKLQADLAIQKLSDDQFKTVIVRTPVVYGPGCKGNFPRLIKLAKICLVFPSIENERSMIYIDNLTEFIRLVIDNNDCGVFFPQNKEYVSTFMTIKIFRELMGKQLYPIKFFNPLIRLLSFRIKFINKVLGNKVYDRKLSDYKNFEYCVVNFEESIKKCV